MWLSLDRDELRNGSSDASATTDATFPRNSLVAGVSTFTLAIAPVTMFRTSIGTAISAKTSADKAKEEAAAAVAAREKLEKEKADLQAEVKLLRDPTTPKK